MGTGSSCWKLRSWTQCLTKGVGGRELRDGLGGVLCKREDGSAGKSPGKTLRHHLQPDFKSLSYRCPTCRPCTCPLPPPEGPRLSTHADVGFWELSPCYDYSCGRYSPGVTVTSPRCLSVRMARSLSNALRATSPGWFLAGDLYFPGAVYYPGGLAFACFR